LVAGAELVLESGTTWIEFLPEIFNGDGSVAKASIGIGCWWESKTFGTLANGLAIATVGKTIAKGKEIAHAADPGFGRHRAQQGCGKEGCQAEADG
jgi:hypothetical protein